MKALAQDLKRVAIARRGVLIPVLALWAAIIILNTTLHALGVTGVVFPVLRGIMLGSAFVLPAAMYAVYER